MSCDTFLGVPFNWVSAAALHMMLAHVAGFELGEFVWMGTDVHVYTNHFDAVEETLRRPLLDNYVEMDIVNKRSSVDDFTIDDFKLVNYNPQGVIKGDVAV